MKHPPDAARKNQLFSETKPKKKDAHQFFFTTGWIERFAQKSTGEGIEERIPAAADLFKGFSGRKRFPNRKFSRLRRAPNPHNDVIWI